MKGQQIIIITLLLVGCKLNGFSFPAGTILTPHLSRLPPGSPWFRFYLAFHPSISWLELQRLGHITDLSSSASPGRGLPQRPV